MEPTKAIEILTDLKDAGIDAGHYDAEDALDLGIEALKLLQNPTDPRLIYARSLLPGGDPQ